MKTIAKLCKKTNASGTSLVAQWLGICLLMQGTLVQALVWEDPTCRGATKPARCSLPQLEKARAQQRRPNEAQNKYRKTYSRGFLGGAVVENLSANAGDMGSSPGLGRSHMPWSN